MSRTPFVGTWKLVVLEFRSDGQVVYPVGMNAQGTAMYDSAGNVSVHVMRPDRASFETGDPLRGTPEELKGALEGYMAYCGTYSVDETHNVVTHRISCSVYPNWVGTDQKRFYKISGDRLIISAPTQLVAGHLLDAILIWERIHTP